MDALKRGDYDALGDAIACERDLIEEQARDLAARAHAKHARSTTQNI
jgi:hypothetical protein